MNYSKTQKRIIIELIKDKFHLNKENIIRLMNGIVEQQQDI